MNFTCSTLENAKELKMLSANCTWGVGFLTSIARWFCNLIGKPCKMYDKKIVKAKNDAAMQLMEKAKGLNADGIMNVTIEIHDTTVFMYGMAYTENK